MKNSLLLLSGATLTNAQDLSRKGFFNKTKLGVAIRTNTTPPYSGVFGDEGNGTEITTINGWHLNQHISLGLGISASTYINPTLSSYPIFVNTHYYFKESFKTPYTFANLGYGITSNRYNGGLLYEIGAGYNLKLGKKTALTPEISYKYQDFRYKTSDSKIALSSIALGIGILF
ncbi:hypothetical protein [Pedobacter puniceum]|uniref:Outer membrane beta-barrel protein n=1 Tax=Pedobacter puniceum TaxID=2666136 RepID=A0A7K0FIK1_9SPHI|nr:hypothetical protein [Pedobacter puniceum]MRX45804.1 hypothetical protein [Pedobacter puniceum]